MKNLNLRIISCLCVAAIVFVGTIQADAQNNDNEPVKEFTPKLELGVRFMPTISSFKMISSTGGTVTGQMTIGYGFGGLLGYNFNKHIELQAEVIYSSISRKYNELDVEKKVTLKYINIPVLFSLNTSKYKTVNVNFVVGPQIGLLVGSKVTTSGGDGTSSATAVLSVKKSDLGLAYGAGVDFGLNKMKTIRLGFGFRGVYGLIDISDNSDPVATDSYYVIDRTHLETYSGYLGFSVLF